MNEHHNYSLDPDRPTPYIVIDNFDDYGKQGVYAGTQEDCEAFIAEQSDCTIIGMYDIIPNPHYKNNTNN